MFIISNIDSNTIKLSVNLPMGLTNDSLLEIAKKEIEGFKTAFYGMNVQIDGRITTILSAWIGHYLAHICKSVSFFDPKENKFILTITH